MGLRSTAASAGSLLNKARTASRRVGSETCTRAARMAGDVPVISTPAEVSTAARCARMAAITGLAVAADAREPKAGADSGSGRNVTINSSGVKEGDLGAALGRD